MEVYADEEQQHNGTDIAEAVPAAGEEPEVQSPLKKPRPETDEADEPAAEPDKPSTAAASAGAPSTKAATGELHEYLLTRSTLSKCGLHGPTYCSSTPHTRADLHLLGL
jgi:hypothetical protein